MLMDMGLADMAEEEMKNRRDAILKSHESNPDHLLKIFECGGALDALYQSLSGKYNKYTYYYPYEDIVSFWKILYPRFQMEDVTSISGELGVPPYLTLSVIRQESRFDPDALSYAGAMGLMQLMPATARQVAGELGEPYDREALFDGAVNMRYGVTYLSKLLKKFDGNIPLAVASYNGGPHNVGTWLKQKWTDRLDLFVELIPFGQTRNYVRRVTTSLIRYTYLYDGTLEPMVDMLGRKPNAAFKKDPSY
jgi:soluble lytic murein transglycosylase